MARYELTNVTICSAYGQKFIKARVINVNDPNDFMNDYCTYGLYNMNHAEKLAPYIIKSRGGLSDVDLPIPYKYRYFYADWEEYKPESRFFWKPDLNMYKRDSNGKVKVYSKMRVLCEYCINEQKKKEYWKHSFPYERGRRRFEYKVRIGEFVPYDKELELQLNNCSTSCDNAYDNYEEEYNWNNDYYNDGLDMDQQSESYWQELGIF